MKKLELPLYLVILCVLGVMVFVEGTRAATLEAQVPLTPQELYKKLAKSQVKLQIVDVRADVTEGYEDTHVPGAIPFPGCDLDKAPDNAKERILPTVPTIVVSAEGDAAAFEKCRSFFTSARNLAGGMTAWDDANLPEDSGEYSPPKGSAGGGCL
jgi:rhodanese-related sulfurtransferase